MQNTQKNPTQKQSKRRISLAKATGWTLLGTGIIALTLSIIYTSSIPAFIGLGLIFWGIILTYIQNEEYVKEPLFEATALSPLATLNQIIQDMNYTGNGIYLSPRYFKNPEANKAYIPKQKDQKLPTPEQIQNQENQLFTQEPQGMLITPPGAELNKFFEKALGTSFTKVELSYLEQNMPKLFTEDLEISQTFQIKTENDKITITLENSIYGKLCKEAQTFTSAYSALGCPLSSALACALSKATGKPITITDQDISKDNKKIKIEFHVINEEHKEK